MTIASTYLADSTLVLHGSIHDHVSDSDLTVVGTISSGTDADGAYVEASGQPGNRLVASALQRVTKSSGATWVVRFKTTATGLVCFSGEIDTGTAYFEAITLNQNTQTGDVLQGTVGVFIRSASGYQDFIRTAALGLNDGNVHTAVIEWVKATQTFNISVDGVGRAVTHFVLSPPEPAAGAMNFPLTLFERNVRSTSYDQSLIGKIYTYARMTNSGFDIDALSADPSILIDAAGPESTVSATLGNVTFSGSSYSPSVSSIASTIGDISFSGASSSPAVSMIAATLGDIVFSGESSGTAGSESTIAATIGDIVFAGTSYSAQVSTIDATLGDVVFSGSSDGSAPAGTISTYPLRDLTTKELRANETGVTIIVNDVTSGELVLKLTGETTNASGVCSFSDAAITAATAYRVTEVLSDGSEGTWIYTAA